MKAVHPMQIAFHIGANCTDEDRLIKSLLKNADTFLKEGIDVPGPGRYRSLIRETINTLSGAQPAADTRDILLDTIVENDDMRRVVMSNGNFICIPKRIFDHGVFYSQVGPKVRALQQMFKGDQLSLYLGIRNPATFLQEVFTRADAGSIPAYLGILQPQEIQWSDVVRRIKEAVPNVPLTVWCNEDTPLLWERLIREISDIRADTAITGGLDILGSIISREGMRLLQDRLQTDWPQSAKEQHQVIADIWEAHALDDRIEDEIDLPELDPALIDQMTTKYDEDVDRIGAMEGVTLLLPAG